MLFLVKLLDKLHSQSGLQSWRSFDVSVHEFAEVVYAVAAVCLHFVGTLRVLQSLV